MKLSTGMICKVSGIHKPFEIPLNYSLGLAPVGGVVISEISRRNLTPTCQLPQLAFTATQYHHVGAPASGHKTFRGSKDADNVLKYFHSVPIEQYLVGNRLNRLVLASQRSSLIAWFDGE